MMQIPDDPMIRCVERTGYPPFMTQVECIFVKNDDECEVDGKDEENDGDV